MDHRYLDRAARFLIRVRTNTGNRTLKLLQGLEPVFAAFAAIGVFIALAALWTDLISRNQERTARAWQIVAAEAPGNTGKVAALEYLHGRKHPLNGIDVSPNSVTFSWDCRYRVYLPYLELPRAQVQDANLSCADIKSDLPHRLASLDDALLHNSKLIRTNAERTSFRGAELISADFRAAQLGQADFTGATLSRTNFQYANMSGVIFDSTIVDGPFIDHAVLTGAIGLDCPTLTSMGGWETACRDAHLACNRTIPKEPCGPSEMPQRAPRVVASGTVDVPAMCKSIDIRREIEFRLDQVDRVVGGEEPTISGRTPQCARATSVYVAAKLAGISRKPPPKEDETVWISGSGYGYRHLPFKTGARSEEFIDHNLPQLIQDYYLCLGSPLEPWVDAQISSLVTLFDRAAGSNPDLVQACSSDWLQEATVSWRRLSEATREVVDNS